MRRWAGAFCICFVLAGCSAPAPQPEPRPDPQVAPPRAAEAGPSVPGWAPPNPGPGAPSNVTPRLLLDLPLGDDPNQLGRMPGRVGGISPRGPVAFAAAWGSIFLVDQAKGRLLHYQDGELVASISVPWLDEQQNSLQITPFGLLLSDHRMAYTLGLNGQLQDLKLLPPPETRIVDNGKEAIPLGRDGQGKLYDRAVGNSGPIARRLSPDGTVLAIADLSALGEIHWSMGRDDALYALAWQWGQGEIERVRVYEVFPTVAFASPPGGADPAAPPTLLGRPLPTRIRLRFPDWAPLVIESETELWNLWWLLSTAEREPEITDGASTRKATLEADFADGSALTLDIQGDDLVVDGARYRVGAARALEALLDSLRLSEQGITAALDDAISIRIALADLPGVAQELSAAQRREVRAALSDVMGVNPYTPPQPLEPPFPQYVLHLKGAAWEGSIQLVGDRYLRSLAGWAALHSGPIATLMRAWLPIPDLQPDQPGYLYLAERVEISPGSDLTRWKSTIVRQLVGARPDPNPQSSLADPFTLTFWVDGERREVQVDREGFTYAGKRYPASGLTNLIYLQGVP